MLKKRMRFLLVKEEGLKAFCLKKLKTGTLVVKEIQIR